jgi:hypothetical protein
VGVVHVNVDVIEQLVVHEVTVALGVVGGKTAVFVKVDGNGLGKICLACFAIGGEIGIQSLGGGAGGKAEHGIILQRNDRLNDFSGLKRHFFVILAANNLHFFSPFMFRPVFIKKIAKFA